MIIEIALRFCNAKTPVKDRGSKIFRARLSVAPGDGKNFQRKRFSIVGGEVLVRPQSIFHPDEREIRRNFSRPTETHNRATRAGLRNGFNEIVAIEILSTQSDKQFAWLNRTRICADPPD